MVNRVMGREEVSGEQGDGEGGKLVVNRVMGREVS